MVTQNSNSDLPLIDSMQVYFSMHIHNYLFRPLDFAPAQAGAIFALTNTVANLSGFLAPQTTGHLLNIKETLSQWQVSP